jgi:hypothetical protein
MAIISIRSCHGPAPNGERRIVATKFAVISPKCRSRLATSGTKLPIRHVRSLIATGGNRTWRGQPNSVEIAPHRTVATF